jgi:hypothetical protein
VQLSPAAAGAKSEEAVAPPVWQEVTEAGQEVIMEAGLGLDAGLEVTMEAGLSVGPEVVMEAKLDAGLEAGLDVLIKAGLDVGLEAELDVVMEAGLGEGLVAGLGVGLKAGLKASAGVEAPAERSRGSSTGTGGWRRRRFGGITAGSCSCLFLFLLHKTR